jgi:hypothetical protein
MTALYPSTSAAQVFVPMPVRLSTTGGSAPISLDYPFTGALADLALSIRSPANVSVVSAALNALPTGVTILVTNDNGFVIQLAASKYTTAGQYFVLLSYMPDDDYAPQATTFQWGGWIDTLFANQTSIISGLAAVELQTDQAVAILSASYDVDDPSAPTVQTLSIGGNPIATRTIANADGSAINPAQVLILGELTAVP